MNLSMVSYFDSTTKSAQLRVSLQEAPQREKKTSPNGQLYFLFRNLLRLLTASYLDSKHDRYLIVTNAITIFHTSIPFCNPISQSQTAAVNARGSSTGMTISSATTSSSDAPAICTTSSTSSEEFIHTSAIATSYSEIQSNFVSSQHTSVLTASKFISPFPHSVLVCSTI